MRPLADRTLPDAAACEEIFFAALPKGDTEGVSAALHLLAVQDPHRAQELLDLTQLALDLAGALPGPET